MEKEESTNKNNENTQSEKEINKIDNKNNTENENPIKCIFKKPTKQRNIRKRSDDLILNTSNNVNEDNDDEVDNEEKDKKKLKSKINQYTTKQDKKDEFSYDSSGNAGSSINSAELSSTQYMNEEEEFKKEVISRNNNNNNNNNNDSISNSEGNNDDGIYRGMKSYSTFVEKKSDLTYKGGGVKAGPMKTSTTFKLSNRIDHQPDVCKDYKQTGQCTFGDACKFLHDRSDYKSGWQIDKEYEEEQKQKRLNNINGIKNNNDNDDNNNNEQQFPFACFICKKQYTDPVQTKCKHFFCEDCALTHNRKNKKCALCGEPTLGTFITPPKKILDQLMEISKSHFKNQS
ncbi:hypothetical protein ACTFIZ_005070 [Dictyostelium cf. discoideum]